jgi:hypothetical protein
MARLIMWRGDPTVLKAEDRFKTNGPDGIPAVPRVGSWAWERERSINFGPIVQRSRRQIGPYDEIRHPVTKQVIERRRNGLSKAYIWEPNQNLSCIRVEDADWEIIRARDKSREFVDVTGLSPEQIVYKTGLSAEAAKKLVPGIIWI